MCIVLMSQSEASFTLITPVLLQNHDQPSDQDVVKQDIIGLKEIKKRLAKRQEILLQVAKYSEQVTLIQDVCNHGKKIIQ